MTDHATLANNLPEIHGTVYGGHGEGRGRG
jgi:hypothetical protein